MNPFERMYPYVPVWAQNVGISLYGLAYRNERLGGNFQAWVEEFRERDRWPTSRMQDFLQEKLRRVLVHAFEQTPYYQRTWTALGITSGDLARFNSKDLDKLPTTPKSDVRLNPADFLSEDAGDKLHRYYTSGSTGTPITCYFTADGHRSFIAAREVRSFGWAGTSIRDPRSMIGGRMVVPRADANPPYYRYNWAERQVYFSAFHISPDRIANYVEGLNRYRPQVLTGYAYSHYALGRMMVERGLQLAYEPSALVLSSEKLTPEMKNVMKKAFRARAYEEYGAVEECVLATECEHGRLHVSSDFGIVEILDEDGNAVPPGCEGRIVCTGLVNRAQPLIRYEIGDIGRWSTKSCPCGRDHLPVLEEICGRLEDAVVSSDGRELVRFHGVFIDLPHVLEAQVIQDQLDLLRIKVVTDGSFGRADEETIRTRITAQRLGGVRVEIEQVPAIERTVRGKFRAVISNVPKDAAAQAKIAVGSR